MYVKFSKQKKIHFREFCVIYLVTTVVAAAAAAAPQFIGKTQNCSERRGRFGSARAQRPITWHTVLATDCGHDSNESICFFLPRHHFVSSKCFQLPFFYFAIAKLFEKEKKKTLNDDELNVFCAIDDHNEFKNVRRENGGES